MEFELIFEEFRIWTKIEQFFVRFLGFKWNPAPEWDGD